MTHSPETIEGVAVVGLAGRFPGAADVSAFWQNLRDGVESISRFSREDALAVGVEPAALDDPAHVRAGGTLEGIEWFDAGFFGFTPRMAEITDPQQRILLELAWEALEHAACDPERYPGRIGVYAGGAPTTYFLNHLHANPALLRSVGKFQAMLANERDYLPTQISYKLNLRGPSVNVQTSCSTSLVAVHLACQGLLSYQCDVALAGGVAVHVPQKVGYFYEEGGIVSPDGHCRAFDARARGTVFGDGAGLVALKRMEDALADGDTIHAVILGSAINNDGALKVGFTAPSVDGQAEVIAEAQALAGVEPETITYVEAHGTGTPLGDPIEIAALTRVFRSATARTGFCAVGSVKTNVGHLDSAAGVTGLIKTVLALEHREIPASLHFERPNPELGLAGTPFYVNARLAPWKADGHPRRAGVSSFGIGGTNAHVVLEEAPPRGVSGPSRPRQLLLLSARSGPALEEACARLAAHLREHPALPLADVAHTLQVGRSHLDHRRVVVCADATEAAAALEAGDPRRAPSAVQQLRRRPVAFLFPGQGAQHPGMAAGLYRVEPAFREEVDRCAELLRPHLGLDVREALLPAGGGGEEEARRLERTALAQPALFVVEYALARLWMEWGVRPEAMLGHSIGEYVAATLAGVFPLEGALALVAARGRIMEEMPGGAMLAVPLPEAELRPLLDGSLSLAAVNAPARCVVAGSEEAVAALEARLAAAGHEPRRLHTSHAFHSAVMEPAARAFEAEVRRVTLRPPEIPFLSNVTGTWIAPEQATDPGYWARHLRETVLFADGVRELWSDPGRVLLEVGPGQALATLARQQVAEGGGERTAVSSLRHPRDAGPDETVLLGALGRLWLAGVEVDWEAFSAREERHRVPLPTYPFQRQRHWVEREGPYAPAGGAGVAEPAAPAEVAAPLPAEEAADAPSGEVEEAVARIWAELLGVRRVRAHDDFFEQGGDSLLATRLLGRLRRIYPVELPLALLFEAPTVAALAEAVTARLVEKLEAMSEEEAQHLL